MDPIPITVLLSSLLLHHGTNLRLVSVRQIRAVSATERPIAISVSSTGNSCVLCSERPDAATGVSVVNFNNAAIRTIRLAGESSLSASCFSANGRTLYLGNEAGDVLVVDVVSLRIQRRWHLHRGPVTLVACSPTRARVYSSGIDHRFCITDEANGRAFASVLIPGAARSIALLPGEQFALVSAGSMSAHRIDLGSAKVCGEYSVDTDIVDYVATSPDGGLAAMCSRSGKVAVLDVASGKTVWTMDAEAGRWAGATFSGDGHTFVLVTGKSVLAIRVGSSFEVTRANYDARVVGLARDAVSNRFQVLFGSGYVRIVGVALE